MTKPRLVLCGGLELPEADPLREGRHALHLDTLNREGNVTLRIWNITRALAHNMLPRVVDLLEIAAYVFAADCNAQRDGPWTNGETEEPWGRDFHFVVPVRDLGFWEREGVQSALVAALRFMAAGDRFGFTFRPLRGDRSRQPYLELGDLEDPPFYEVERVVMFSGGLDSLAGAVEVAAAGQPLVAVSHRPAPQVSTVQAGLIAELGKRFPVPVRHIPVWVNKHRNDAESSQRTRSFLFSALGVAVASALRAGGVRFCENGVTTLNWPVAQEVTLSRATRSTHPITLDRLQELYRLLTEKPEFVVDNPFAFVTKAEVVARIAAAGAPDLIGMSASCIHTRLQPSKRRHCGLCRQCLDRRIAVLASGQEDHERDEDYRAHVFTGPREGDYDHNIAVDYTRFASDLDGMEVSDIAFEYGHELSRAVRPYEHQADVAQQFLDLYKRHAATVCRVIDAQLRAHASDLRAGRLARACLLRMIGKGEHLERSAKAEALPVNAPTATVLADANVFRRSGERWTVSYEGQPADLNHRKGLVCICYLLAHPEHEYSARELQELAGLTAPAESALRQQTAGELEQDGMVTAGDTPGVAILDRKLREQVRREIRDLDRMVEEAERDDDKALLEWAKGERQKLFASVAGALDKSGRSRKFPTDASKLKDSIEKDIGRALAVIAKYHAPLALHLKGALRRRDPFCYKPDRHVTWLTD